MKSSLVRPLTILFFLSRTVAKRLTTFTSAEKLGRSCEWSSRAKGSAASRWRLEIMYERCLPEASGYTGSMMGHEPKAATEMTWQARFASLRYVRPLMRLVWETSPPLVLGSVSLRLARALLPVAMLWIPKLIIDAVVAWVGRHQGSPERIWKLVAVEFGLAILSDFLSRGTSLCD